MFITLTVLRIFFTDGSVFFSLRIRLLGVLELVLGRRRVQVRALEQFKIGLFLQVLDARRLLVLLRQSCTAATNLSPT